MIIDYKSSYYSDLCHIFWKTSSKKTFKSKEAKDAFQNKYLDLYLEHDKFMGLINTQQQGAADAYIIGVTQVDKTIFKQHEFMQSFKSVWKKYPAELHINLLPETQGQGLGTQLLQAFEQKLRDSKINGIHLYTLRSARNYNFYIRNSYNLIHAVDDLVMLGKELS